MESFSCDTPGCLKSYKSKINLKRHKEAFHNQTKKYQCPCCSKVLSSKQNLQEHQLTHSKELPFMCKEPGCGKRFRHGSQFSAHKRIHNVIKAVIQIDGKEVDTKIITSILVKNEEKLIRNQIDPGLGAKFLLPKIGKGQRFSLPIL